MKKTPKRGRPSSAGVARSERITIRLTPTERRTIERAAGEEVGAWVRDAALERAKEEILSTPAASPATSPGAATHPDTR